MFINWAHFIIPKISFALSFIANPIFVYLIQSAKAIQFGDYRYLLYFFATFNISAAVIDLVVPICVHSYRYATVFFNVDGLFSERSEFGPLFVSLRCSFISGTYGILNSHFIFRYLVLKNKHFVSKYFLPYGLILSILLVVFHIGFWCIVVTPTMIDDEERRNYTGQSFQDEFREDFENINAKIVVFAEASTDVVVKSWSGAIIVTIIASYSMILYFVLGYKIMSGLNQGSTTMSHKTMQMQKRLLWALTVQTIIPICVSFMPCCLVMYGSAFRIGFPSWINWGSSIAVSMFPFLDPMAIIFCLPALRQRLFQIFGIDLKLPASNQVNTTEN